MYVTPGQARVLTPILAMAGGGLGAAYAGMALSRGDTQPAIVLGLALSLAFAGAGAIALNALWRKRNGLSGEQRIQGERANVALFVIWALVVLSVIFVAASVILTPDAPQPPNAALILAIFVAGAVVMAIGAVIWFRNRPRMYDGLDGLNAARLRDSLRRILPDPRGDRR